MDVHYGPHSVVGAVVGFGDWTDGSSTIEDVVPFQGAPGSYVPGSFAKRELPFLVAMAAVARGSGPVDAVIVDGYAWLDGGGRPGLGAHLHQALGGATPIIGVAKTHFVGSDAFPVRRGASDRPLFVSAAGLDNGEAAGLVSAMHGPHRLPTLLKHVDRLARGVVGPAREKSPHRS